LNLIGILILILLSTLIVFVSNFIFLFNVNPIVMILFIIVAIVGIISYVDDDGEHDFTYGVSFGIGVIISFVVLIPIEIFGWNGIILPIIDKAAPFLDTSNVTKDRVLYSIIIAIEEPIVIGILLPLIFSGIARLLRPIGDYIDNVRREKFKNEYLDGCLKLVTNSLKPIKEKNILGSINYGNGKYNEKINYDLLCELRKRTYYDSEHSLYWGKESYYKMKESIENALLNTSPKPLDWLITHVDGYRHKDYYDVKVAAIEELRKSRIFVLETTTGGTFNSDSETTKLYRHYSGSKINTVVYDDDPDFY